MQAAVEDDLLKSNPKRPSRSCKLNVKSIQWNDLSPTDAESRVIVKGQSLLVLGSPISGKGLQIIRLDLPFLILIHESRILIATDLL